MIKEECFAYKKEKQECNCLKELYCKKEKCNFYKNKEEMKSKYIVR